MSSPVGLCRDREPGLVTRIHMTLTGAEMKVGTLIDSVKGISGLGNT